MAFGVYLGQTLLDTYLAEREHEPVPKKGSRKKNQRAGNRSDCLTGFSEEESHAGKIENTVVFRGWDESGQCPVHSFVPA
uniref:hypothetical protein n=1 Tax=Enterocloster clostridioformis TaxID=1531 RepID=UPI0025A4E07B|nr:hypothetical protein [Enterocloster clostridioformis]